MSKVIVTKTKLDNLANAISAKSGEPVTMTLDEMVSAVDGIDQGITPTGNINITEAGVTDVTQYATATVPEPTIGDSGIDNLVYYTQNNNRFVKLRFWEDYATGGWMDDGVRYTDYSIFSAIAKNTTVTPTESAQTIGGANTMLEGAVTVNAIPSNYVGSGVTRCDSDDIFISSDVLYARSGYYENSEIIYLGNMLDQAEPTATASFNSSTGVITATAGLAPYGGGSYSIGGDYAYANKSLTDTDTLQLTTRSSSDLSASGATVTAPSGYYASAATKTIASGTEGTPTATKGTVSNNAISVTPSVTNTAGYISGGTHTGTAVSVSASELVSGTLNVTSSGTKDVTNYASISVPSGDAGIPSNSTTKQDGYYTTVRSYPNMTAGYFSSLNSNIFQLTLEDKSVNPSTSSQTVTPTGNGYYLNSVTVAAMPTGTAGTPTATKGTVSNHSVSVTPSVTNTTGYITGSTINGTAVTVSASELVSGSTNIGSSGSINVTNYASVVVPELTLPSTTSSTSSGTQKLYIAPSDDTRYINIPTGFNDNPKYYNIGGMNRAPLSVTQNGTYNASDPQYDLDGFSSVTVNVSGGGGSAVEIGVAQATLYSAANSISFSGMSAAPTSFIAMVAELDGTIQTGASPFKVVAVVWDGTSYHGQTITNTNNAQVTYDSSSFSASYNAGTLTITSTGAYFQPITYGLLYSYNGSAGNVGTADVQVGSGATSITFTGLEARPEMFSCIFKSNFSTSSGYQRTIAVACGNEETQTDSPIGLCMDSAAHVLDAWTWTYNNGSLTITSNGTNEGGYFHQPGYYQLTYVIPGEVGNYQAKTVTPTTSSQTVTADSGYDALSRVTVNAIPSSYVQPTSTVGATTYRASTSNQTINAGTYHSAAATIAAVSATNLEAGNIKSGTTISISNGQSNLWSVTGTYTGGGGGGSSSIDTKTLSNSNDQATSLAFTSMKGEPIAFFLRCTSQLTRSSSYSYYYITAVQYNGTNTQGNYYRRSNGTYYADTTHYSYTYSGTTLTISSSASRGAAGGSFYNGNYELVYIY